MTLMLCQMKERGEKTHIHCHLKDRYGQDVAGEDTEEDWGEIGEKKTQ